MRNNFIDFSLIDSELKAYLIGLFYADATLTDYCITTRLSIKDKEYIDKLAHILNKPTFEGVVKNKNGKVYKFIGFHICSKKSVDSLRNIGFIKNKTYQIDDVVFQNIPDNLKKHFIRGFFDGDGTIYFSKWKANVNWNTNPKCSIGFVSINKKILESIKYYLSENFEISIDKELRADKFEDESKNEKYWRLIYNGNRICKNILDFLYNNSSIYMGRKYNKYLEIVEYKPKGYHYHTSDKAWRVPYKDENGIQKYKNFKTEIDAEKFSNETKNKIKNYEKFISKVVK